mmetsp:Transcript_18194/g.45519  ORF Transcript_18194/g.45519 Transcript_18194/m.45519 type:complete len:695 (-) Transcript_18194:318-2402(-)
MGKMERVANTLKVYVRNSMKKGKKEELIPRYADGRPFLTWYSCGPTVYDVAHLGHARTYVCFDLIKRALKGVFGVSVVDVMGVTDIDMKIINRAEEVGVHPTQLARKYEKKFFDDMRRLGVSPPSGIARVTEHIDDIDRFVSTLVQSGYAYASDDGSVYFDVKRYGKEYGVLRAVEVEEGNVAEAHDSRKKHAADFALWKSFRCSDFEGWKRSYARGIPGWHIECSAMINSIFGEMIDVHVGGIDLAFPHHENEIAQSKALLRCEHGDECDKEWVRYFLHTGHLHIAGRKMSKSLKNFVTIPDIFQQAMHDGFDGVKCRNEGEVADAFRLLCCSTHYRSRFEYSERRMGEAVEEAAEMRGRLAKIQAVAERRQREGREDGKRDSLTADDMHMFEKVQTHIRNFESALSNDFDMKHALFELNGAAKIVERRLLPSADPPSSFALLSSTSHLTSCLSTLGFVSIIPPSSHPHPSSAHSHASPSASSHHHTCLHTASDVVEVGEKEAERRVKERAEMCELRREVEEDEAKLRQAAESIAEVREQLREIAENRRKEGGKKEELARLYSISDHLRDSVLPSFGWTCQDGIGLVPLSSPAYPTSTTAGQRGGKAGEAGEEYGDKQSGGERRGPVQVGDMTLAEWMAAEYKYTAFDEDGMPTSDEKGKPLSKSGQKKAKKRAEKYEKARLREMGAKGDCEE